MKALILAAGRGSRMGGLTQDAPKCMVPLAGRPLLDWQVAALRRAGADTVGVVTGYMAETLAGRGLALFNNPRWEQTNMVQSLACARDWLATEPVVVSYSDIVYPAAVVTALRAAEADIAITYDPDWRDLWSKRFADPLADAETFRTQGNHVVEIGGKTARIDDIEGQYMGLLKFTPAGWQAVEAYLLSLPPSDRDRLDMTSLLSALIKAGQRVEGVAVRCQWGEVDSAGDLAVYEQMIASGAWSLEHFTQPAA